MARFHFFASFVLGGLAAWVVIEMDSMRVVTPTWRDLVVDLYTPAIAKFRIDVGRLPTMEEGLEVLIFCPPDLFGRWKGPYLSYDSSLLDNNRRPLRYRVPGVHNPSGYDVYSTGADGIESDDDWGNW
jgi:general secretion pathway protein G